MTLNLQSSKMGLGEDKSPQTLLKIGFLISSPMRPRHRDSTEQESCFLVAMLVRGMGIASELGGSTCSYARHHLLGGLS